MFLAQSLSPMPDSRPGVWPDGVQSLPGSTSKRGHCHPSAASGALKKDPVQPNSDLGLRPANDDAYQKFQDFPTFPPSRPLPQLLSPSGVSAEEGGFFALMGKRGS